MNYFRQDSRTAYDAKAEAQRIAFAPLMFQACRILRDSGILELVQKAGQSGLTLDEVVEPPGPVTPSKSCSKPASASACSALRKNASASPNSAISSFVTP